MTIVKIKGGDILVETKEYANFFRVLYNAPLFNLENLMISEIYDDRLLGQLTIQDVLIFSIYKKGTSLLCECRLNGLILDEQAMNSIEVRENIFLTYIDMVLNRILMQEYSNFSPVYNDSLLLTICQLYYKIKEKNGHEVYAYKMASHYIFVLKITDESSWYFSMLDKDIASNEVINMTLAFSAYEVGLHVSDRDALLDELLHNIPMIYIEEGLGNSRKNHIDADIDEFVLRIL